MFNIQTMDMFIIDACLMINYNDYNEWLVYSIEIILQTDLPHWEKCRENILSISPKNRI